jgi:formate/nitrite transporter FocA (FNT family)
MFFIPMGLFVKANETFIAAHPGPSGVEHLTWGRFLGANLLPVTIGNIVGGALMVGAFYWFVYLRRPTDEVEAAPQPERPTLSAG